jgi:hypothetical protein
MIGLSEGHQQSQLDNLPCQADFRLVLKTGSYFRPDPLDGSWSFTNL